MTRLQDCGDFAERGTTVHELTGQFMEYYPVFTSSFSRESRNWTFNSYSSIVLCMQRQDSSMMRAERELCYCSQQVLQVTNIDCTLDRHDRDRVVQFPNRGGCAAPSGVSILYT